MMVLSNNSSFFIYTQKHLISLCKIVVLSFLFFVTTCGALAVNAQATSTSTYASTDSDSPVVSSVTFSDPEAWYDTVDGVFTWDVPSDVTRIAVEIATSSENEPVTTVDSDVEEFVISEENVVDGIQYLSIQFKYQDGWGAILNRKIQIDTTPPENFDISIQTGTAPASFPLLVFEAKDPTSGIEKYTLVINGKKSLVLTPDEARFGYLLRDLEDGVYAVKVTAFDKAGNKTESRIPVLITAGWTSPNTVSETVSFWSFLVGTNILIGFLVGVVISLFGYLFYLKKQYRIREEKLQKEMDEVQEQMQKIFSALRDEIYDQINNISKRPRLSAKEKEAVDSLNLALQVSKTLLEKEINSI